MFPTPITIMITWIASWEHSTILHWAVIFTVSHYHSSLCQSGLILVIAGCDDGFDLSDSFLLSPSSVSLALWLILMNRWMEEGKKGACQLVALLQHRQSVPSPSFTSYPSCPLLFHSLVYLSLCPLHFLSSVLLFASPVLTVAVFETVAYHRKSAQYNVFAILL